MRIDVLMTEEIFLRFTTFDVLRRRKMWRAPVTFAAILSVCAIVCFVMRHVRGAIFLGSVLLVVGLGMPVVYFVSFYFSLRKQVRVLGLKRPQNVYSLELTREKTGIHVWSKKEKADYEWKRVYHAYRDTLATYLYLNPVQAFVLPHTCLQDQEPDALWALLKDMVPADKLTVL